MTRRGWAELFALLAPPACVACREPLRRADELLCGGCLRALPWLRGLRCPRCGLPRHARGGCPAAGAAFDRAWSPMAYDGAARALVQALKLRAALPAAGVMAAQIAATLPADLVAPPARPCGLREALGGAVIVAVPPQRSRRRARGFDPAAALARSLAPRLGLPLVPALVRSDRASRQARAGRVARRAQGRMRVAATRPVGSPVLLVDDVHTTGATLDACARALREAGAPRVVAVTYARTLLARGSGT